MRSSRFPDLPKSSRSQTTTPKGGLNFVSKEDQRRARNRQAQRNHRLSVKQRLEEYERLQKSLETSDTPTDSGNGRRKPSTSQSQDSSLPSSTSPTDTSSCWSLIPSQIGGYGLGTPTDIDSWEPHYPGNKNTTVSASISPLPIITDMLEIPAEMTKGPCASGISPTGPSFNRAIDCSSHQVPLCNDDDSNFMPPELSDITGTIYRPSNTRTILHQCVIINNEEMTSVLLEHGVDFKARDGDGRTPLHLAALLGHEETARVLLSNGAAVTLSTMDGFGLTPLQLAVENQRVHMVRLLAEFGADVNQRY